MKVTLSLALLSSVSAFAPTPFTARQPISLQLELEGREIEGALVPCTNFILVKVAEAEDQTEGGIILSGRAKQKKTEGVVVSVGQGRTHQESGITFPMPVSQGEGVVYGKYDGTELDYDGCKHTLIRDTDIMVKYSGGKLTLETCDVTSDTVLVKVNRNGEEEMASGLLIASSASSNSKPSTGKVVKVGPGRMAENGEMMDMDVAVGDEIKFRDFAGNDVSIEREDYAVVRMPDILAKF